jgi:triosephosphate isomerase
MTRKPIIFGNWKMNKTPNEAVEFFKGIEGYVNGNEAADYGIGAPYVDLDIAVKNAGKVSWLLQRTATK